MADERKERCDKCRFWRRHEVEENEMVNDADDALGTCSRYPPQFLSSVVALFMEREEKHQDYVFEEVTSPSSWKQPTSWGCDWCGEWQPVSLPNQHNQHEDQNISVLGLSSRARNAIWKCSSRKLEFGDRSLLTVADVLTVTREQLEHAKNCGEKTVKEIIVKLAAVGLKLKGD